MGRSKINKINVERLTRWKDRLNNEHATPIMLLGVGHDHKSGQLVVLTTEERSDQELLLFLREATRMLETQLIKRQ